MAKKDHHGIAKVVGPIGAIPLPFCCYPHEQEEILDPMDLINQYQEKRASLNAEIDHVLEKITSLLGGN